MKFNYKKSYKVPEVAMLPLEPKWALLTPPSQFGFGDGQAGSFTAPKKKNNVF